MHPSEYIFEAQTIVVEEAETHRSRGSGCHTCFSGHGRHRTCQDYQQLHQPMTHIPQCTSATRFCNPLAINSVPHTKSTSTPCASHDRKRKRLRSTNSMITKNAHIYSAKSKSKALMFCSFHSHCQKELHGDNTPQVSSKFKITAPATLRGPHGLHGPHGPHGSWHAYFYRKGRCTGVFSRCFRNRRGGHGAWVFGFLYL